MFKKGDIVVCIDDGKLASLVENGEYEVSEVNGPVIYVSRYGIYIGSFFKSRFKLKDNTECV